MDESRKRKGGPGREKQAVDYIERSLSLLKVPALFFPPRTGNNHQVKDLRMTNIHALKHGAAEPT